MNKKYKNNNNFEGKNEVGIKIALYHNIQEINKRRIKAKQKMGGEYYECEMAIEGLLDRKAKLKSLPRRILNSREFILRAFHLLNEADLKMELFQIKGGEM